MYSFSLGFPPYCCLVAIKIETNSYTAFLELRRVLNKHHGNREPNPIITRRNNRAGGQDARQTKADTPGTRIRRDHSHPTLSQSPSHSPSKDALPTHPQRFRPSRNRPRPYAPAQPPLIRPPRARNHAPTGDRAAACPLLWGTWPRLHGRQYACALRSQSASQSHPWVKPWEEGTPLPDKSSAAR